MSSAKRNRGEHGAEDAGLAVVERAHGVEGVGGADGAGGDGGAGLGGCGVGVADGDADAAGGGMGGELEAPGSSGARVMRRTWPSAASIEAVEDGDVGGEQMLGGLHAALGVGEERTFEMDADGAGDGLALGGRAMSLASAGRGAEGRVDGAVTVVAR